MVSNTVPTKIATKMHYKKPEKMTTVPCLKWRIQVKKEKKSVKKRKIDKKLLHFGL